MTEANHDDPRSGRVRQRLPIPGVFVAIDAPAVSDQHWVVDALDINANGLGLVLPPELAEGTIVELTFSLADGIEFTRLPAVVRHKLTVSGGVSFETWPATERLKLLEYLVAHYEFDDES